MKRPPGSTPTLVVEQELGSLQRLGAEVIIILDLLQQSRPLHVADVPGDNLAPLSQGPLQNHRSIFDAFWSGTGDREVTDWCSDERLCLKCKFCQCCCYEMALFTLCLHCYLLIPPYLERFRDYLTLPGDETTKFY